MGDQLKFIVNELNKINPGKVYNIISFDSLHADQLLQVLTDVFAEVDPSNKVDVRMEEPEQTTVRVLEMLRVLKYKPGPSITASTFRQGIIQGETTIVYPILEWLLRNREDLKKRVYLAQFLVKVDVPYEILADSDVAAMYEQYEQLIEDFKNVHKESEAMKNSGFSTMELRSDIDTMEKEKDIVVKRIERMERKVDNVGNKDEMLKSAHALRMEREREKELINQEQELDAALNHSDQRILRLKNQLKDLRQSAIGATPEGLVQRLDEETNVLTYLVKQKLPKDLSIARKEADILEMVVNEPAMGRGDLDVLNDKIQTVNKEVNKIAEQHLASNNPADDKLAPFRQQAAIIARKKEKTVEQITELKSDLLSLNQETEEKKIQLQEFAGETVLRGDEFKRYVNKLRGRSAVYKRHRAELMALKAEAGVLSRTIDVLKSRDEAVVKGLSAEEAHRGVAGVRDTEERLESVSGQKANVDQEKGHTLEDMSALIVRLSQNIASKKAQLAPVIKELRPLREECQEMTEKYEEKKKVYNTTAANLESKIVSLEQSVRSLRDDIDSGESKIFFCEAESAIYRAKLDQLAEEVKLYVSSNPADKSKSLRERFMQHVNEQEKLARHLKEDQRLVKDNQTNRARQMKLWGDLQKLLDCKKRCLENARQNAGTVHREKGSETLVLNNE